jgi:4-hydroxybenzoate polyprenyltransferase
LYAETIPAPETRDLEFRGRLPASPTKRSSKFIAWVALLRPLHWSKNGFVFAPFLFTEWAQDWHNFSHAVECFAQFCLLSSAIYIVNDVRDAAADRLHPRKRRRPIASGRISPRDALCAAMLMAVTALFWAWSLRLAAFAAAGAYVLNGVLYCAYLKRHAIMDVLSIAVGFLLRLLGGCAAIGVEPSSWLLVCGFSLALFLGFGKRRTEIERLGNAAGFRPTLGDYTVQKLDVLLAITCAVSLLSYLLFTTAPETVERHQSSRLVFTSVFVAYGLFRYLFKCQEGKGDGPTDILGRDPVFFLNGVLWATSVFLVLRVKL